jgi:hypothetical protein
MVDLAARTLSLDVGTTKNDKGRRVFLTDTLVALLTEQLRGRKKTDYILMREDGSTVLSFNDR